VGDRAIRNGMVGVLALLLLYLAFGDKPWDPDVAERIAQGKPLRAKDWAARFEWWACLLNAALVAALLATRRRWLQLEPPPEGAQGAAGAETALELNIVEIYAPFLSDHVFYVQENAFGDPRRVLSQRLFVFDVAGDARILQRTLGFAEPNRWRDGHLNTDLFKGLMGQDVGASAGACALEWTFGPEAFTGKAPSAGTCIGMSRAELTGRGLTVAEPELRFIRRR